MNVRLSRREFFTTGAAVTAAASLPVPALAARNAHAAAAAPHSAIIRLSANENPYGPGPLARAAMLAAQDDACRYAMEAVAPLVAKLAVREGVDKAQIVLGSGSAEILNMLAVAFCERNELVCAWPTFEQIPGYAEKLGADVRKIPLDAEMRHDLPALASAVTPNTALLYLCNPNNPTGTVIAGAPLRAFCEEMARQTLVVIDEAYLDLVEPGATESMLDLVHAGRNVVVLRTFSKIHGLAGLRIGYGITRPDVAMRLKRLQMAIPNTIGLYAAAASLDDTAFLATTRARLVTDRSRILQACAGLGLRCANAQGNFVFMNVGMPVETFRARLHAKGIDVGRPFEPYREWCRVTVGTTVETDAFLAALPEALRG